MGINLREKPVNEMSMCELAYNDCYVKDGQAMYRNYSIDMSARELIRSIYKSQNVGFPYEFWTDDEVFDEIMLDNLQYGYDTVDGLIAMLYQQIWSKAEMREILLKVSKGEDIQTLIKNLGEIKNEIFN